MGWLRHVLRNVRVGYYTHRLAQLKHAGAGSEHPQVIMATTAMMKLLMPKVLSYETMNQLDISSNFISLHRYYAYVNVIAVAIKTQCAVPNVLVDMTHTPVTYPSADWLLNAMRNQREALTLIHLLMLRYIEICSSLNKVSDVNLRTYYARRLSGITGTNDELVRIFKRLH